MYEIVIIRRIIIIIFIVLTFKLGIYGFHKDGADVQENLKSIDEKLNQMVFKLEYLDNSISPLNARLRLLEDAIFNLTAKVQSFALFEKTFGDSVPPSARQLSKRSNATIPEFINLDHIVQEQRQMKNAIDQSSKVTAQMNATLNQLKHRLTRGISPAELVHPSSVANSMREVIAEFLETASMADENIPENYKDSPANSKPKKIHTVDLFRQLWKKFTRPLWNVSKRLNELEELGYKGIDLCQSSNSQAQKLEALISSKIIPAIKPAYNCCDNILQNIDRANARTDVQYHNLENRLVHQNALIEKILDKLPSIISSVQVDADATVVENEPEIHLSDCSQLQNKGVTENGVYTIYVNEIKLQVYCDFKSYDGGWTVIQRRGYFPNNQENFNRNWSEYKNGFGDLDREFWLGNENLHLMTISEDVTLLVQLRDFLGNYAFAFYKSFRVNSEEDFYRLNLGEYNGNASDSFAAHNQKLFSTYDRINDEVDPCCSCALTFEGGWWFYACFEAHLNGPYQQNPMDNGYFRGIIWEHWKGDYSLKESEMKIRPSNFKKTSWKESADDNDEASVEDP